jgi:hypothetical protein
MANNKVQPLQGWRRKPEVQDHRDLVQSLKPDGNRFPA